jgi:hypothetical protein
MYSMVRAVFTLIQRKVIQPCLAGDARSVATARNRFATTAPNVKGTNSALTMSNQSVVGQIGFRVHVLAVQGRRMATEILQGAGVVVPGQMIKIVLLEGLVRPSGIRRPCIIAYPARARHLGRLYSLCSLTAK